MFALNCETWTWKRFFYYEGPPCRLHGAFTVEGNYKYYYGGITFPENLVLNDLWQLSFDQVVWHENALELPGVQWNKIEFEEENYAPGVQGHQMVALSDKQLFLFGGFDQSGICKNEQWIINLEDKKVTKLNGKGEIPAPRAYHVNCQSLYQLFQRMVQIKDNLLCLFGGVSSSFDSVKQNKATLLNDFYFLNLNEAYWSKAMIGGYLPSARYCCSLSSNCSDICCQLLIFGGKSNIGIKESAIFILSEIDQNEQEQWGYIEENKQQNEDFLQDVQVEKQPKDIPKINLELNEAEKMIQEQKEAISEKEQMLKKLQQKKIELRNKYKQIDKVVEQQNKEFNGEMQDTQKQLEEAIQRNGKNKQLFEKLKVLLICERKKRKFLQQKAFSLQDSLKQSENFIITIDSLYNKGIREDLFQGIVNMDALQKLAQKKIEHREILANFRDEFEQCFQRETTVRNEMKNSKTKLQPLINLSQLLRDNLNTEEKKILNIKE